MGPLGWMILGAEKTKPKSVSNSIRRKEKEKEKENEENLSKNHNMVPDHSGFTFDCWKMVLRNFSNEPSKGKYLKDVVSDSRIKQVLMTSINETHIPGTVENNFFKS